MPPYVRLMFVAMVLLGSGLSLRADDSLQGDGVPVARPGQSVSLQGSDAARPEPRVTERLTPPSATSDMLGSTTTADTEPMRLKPPGTESSERPARGLSNPFVTMLGSLGVVLGLFLVIVWFTRRSLPKTPVNLPGEVVEVLGRTPLAARQYMHLIRVGQKLLLVSMSSAGAETLTEITDPAEVERLTGACRRGRSTVSISGFREVFSQLGAEGVAARTSNSGTARRVS